MELKKYKLGEIAEITTGFPFDGHKYCKKGTRVVRGENIGAGSLHWEERVDKRWNDYNEKLNDYLLYKGDIVMQMDGNIGKNMARIEANAPMLLAQRVACIRAKDSFSQDYIYGLLRTSSFFKYITKCTTGTSIQHISLKQISDFEFPIPEPQEQRKIGYLLSTLDRKIALCRATNKTLEAMAKQLYDYWFVQFDFPNENGKPYKTNGGKMVYNPQLKREVPEGWEVKELNNWLEIKSGFAFNSAHYLERGKYKVITIKNVQNHFLDTSKCDFLDEIPSEIKKWCILSIDDRLISLTGNCGRLCIVTEDNLLLNQRVGLLACKEKFKEFAYLMLSSFEFQAICDNLANGAAQANLSPIDLCNKSYFVPNDDILKQFNAKINPIFKKIILNHREISTLTTLRDSLLPLLMNGQVTVGA